MRPFQSIARIGLLLALMTSTPLAARAQTQAELALPSLSIFGFPLPPSAENKKFDSPFSAQELESFLVEVDRVRPDQTTTGTQRKKSAAYFIVPFVFYRSRHLFKPQIWTQSDIEEGQLISHFFARLVERPELEIKATDQESFGRGLQQLRDWFVALTQNNETLSEMVITFDDGPYQGEKVDEKKFLQWKRLASATIPGSKSKFVLMTDDQKPEPMIIGVMNADNSLLWARRYSDKPAGRGNLDNATLRRQTATKVEGYGYKLVMSMSGEASVVYLDEKLKLRFYYVSW